MGRSLRSNTERVITFDNNRFLFDAYWVLAEYLIFVGVPLLKRFMK
jgi:hypothetical protein